MERKESAQRSVSSIPPRRPAPDPGAVPGSDSSPSGFKFITLGSSRRKKKASGTESARISAPKAIQVMRQLVARSRYIPRGTSSSPPADRPAAFSPTTVARRFWNQRDSRVPVLFSDIPLNATEDTKPKIKIR